MGRFFFLIAIGRQSKDQKSKNQNVGLAHGFLDIPDAEAVGRQHQCDAGFDVEGFTVVGGEGAAALDEVTEFLGNDLPTPAAGRAFPDAGFDPVVALDGGGRSHRDRRSRRQGAAVRLIKFQCCGVLELRDAHGSTCRLSL
jgi:hypothetical protein